jgi:tetratricopeptide (TPR) repeat protein
MRFDSPLYSTVFMALPENERAVINSRIIEKSRRKAIEEKDVSYMNQVANYVQGSYAPGSLEGRKSRDLNMVRYYKEVNDSANYISSARRFYQQYLENVNVDSISAIEKSKFIINENGSRLSGGNLYEIGNQINELAWTIYELSSDPEHLGLALKWSERTLVYQHPPYHDTYAHILYKLGAREKAIEWQEKAVKLSESKGIQNKNMSAELEKMKNGETF